MGRPLTKMTEGKLKTLISKYPTETDTALARELGIDRATLRYYVKKLRKSGLSMRKHGNISRQSGAQKLIDKVIAEMQKKP